MQAAADKDVMRSAIRAARQRRTAAQRAACSAALMDIASDCRAGDVAAFVPLPHEPGDHAVLAALRAGRRVALPVIHGSRTALQWGWYDGAESLHGGPYGIAQPAAVDGLRLSDLKLILVPALALSSDGRRLGQGGGFYDRALAGIETERIVGVVHDEEVCADLPTQPHDVRVGWICTPSGIRRAVPAD